MQAIILAAGMGRRLGELTNENTKCMVNICGKTLIERLLEQISEHNFKQIVFVIGYFGDKLKSLIGNNYKDIPVKYVENPDYKTTNNIYSLYLAKDYLLKDDTILFESDLIIENTILNDLINNPYANLTTVAKYENWMDGTVITIDEENNILSFIPKKEFVFSNTDKYYKTVNIYKFSSSFSENHYIPFLEAYSRTMGKNEYYEDVLRVISFLNHSTLKAHVINPEQKWYEIDDIQDVDIAQTLFANNDNILSNYQKRFGGYWRFPKLLDFCYLVNPYFPTERMKDELKSYFDTLLSNYPSSLNVNCLLVSKFFGIKHNYLAVGNGAAELIKELMYLLPGKTGIMFPAFEEYYNRKDSNDFIPYYVNNDSFNYTSKDIMSFFSDKKIKSLLLINPDNPSGNFIPINDVLEIASWTNKRNITFILDESFVDFSEGSVLNSLLKNEILEQFPNMIIIKSISKSYGVPGLRLGILASNNSALINQIKKELSIWNINSFAEYFMQIFNKYEKDYINACNKIISVRAEFLKDISQIKYLRVIPSMANYFLCEVKPPFTATELTFQLLNNFNILIKNCKSKCGFSNKEFVRIAVRSEEDNNRLLEALKKINNGITL
ncbi:MAG: aminotransferase class I/II-fold pyridoxal phosphate-dependent enzyme [Treponema sp.]|nr:aminotransferase class I/II-fold pyridoxal phosphate-dependent enzyme [Treponema sp.]MCL2250382.1 aminotransferase class I/II-fold pyridoxal phosphate-dependent enzyme [Treponema sp.]